MEYINIFFQEAYKILFLQDVVDTLPLNATNYLEAKEYFPNVSKDNILTVWSQKLRVQDDWESLKKSGLTYSTQSREYFKEIIRKRGREQPTTSLAELLTV